jgi:hypothetical protein
MVRYMALAAMIILGACAPGCAVPITVAATAGISAAQAGSTAWVNGELREGVLSDLETTHNAALLALSDLEADIFTERRGSRSSYIMAKEPGGKEIRISMVRRTPKLTRLGIRIGIIGELSTSRAVLNRVLAHVPNEFEINAEVE